MAVGSTEVKVSLPEIYEILCDKCKKRLKDLIRSKIADQMVEQVIGGEKKR